MSNRNIYSFNEKDWAISASLILQNRLEKYLSCNGKCTVVLTGGRTACELYEAWGALKAFQDIKGTCFYFGDERCISFSHKDSNYRLAMNSLFKKGIPAGCSVFRMPVEEVDLEHATFKYELLMPKSPDILLLGVGEDGHIASLFPGGEALNSSGRKIAITRGLNIAYKRMTITPQVIDSSKSVYLIARGKSKGLTLAYALEKPEEFRSFPVRIAIHSNWLIDDEALKELPPVLDHKNNQYE